VESGEDEEERRVAHLGEWMVWELVYSVDGPHPSKVRISNAVLCPIDVRNSKCTYSQTYLY